MRWRVVFAIFGLFLFACVSAQAVRRDQSSGRYFWWSGIPLDSKRLMAPGSACKDGTDRCGEWGPESILVDYGLVTKSLVVLAFPAFLLGGLIGKGVGAGGRQRGP